VLSIVMEVVPRAATPAFARRRSSLDDIQGLRRIASAALVRYCEQNAILYLLARATADVVLAKKNLVIGERGWPNLRTEHVKMSRLRVVPQFSHPRAVAVRINAAPRFSAITVRPAITISCGNNARMLMTAL
jgi:hypothetical protein